MSERLAATSRGTGASRRSRPPSRVVALISLLGLAMTSGCHREWYRRRADRDTQAILAQRQTDPRWTLPGRPVEASPLSRLHDPADADRAPIPLDDPAARPFQVSAGRSHEFHGWKNRGIAAEIEPVGWEESLPRDDRGRVLLDRASVVRLGVTHSRDYQSEVEDLYLTALGLTLSRFEFQIRGGSSHGAFFQNAGSRANQSNQWQLNNSARLEQNLMSGGQWIADFANALVFEFSGGNFQQTSSSILVAVTQPLLRGAFARIRTQALSEAERDVLYRTRDFARFRRTFYVGLVGRAGYLGLLSQAQGIRNLESNLVTLERNLAEHEALVQTGLIAPFQRDQVFQQYQEVRFQLLAARADLQTALDGYKQRIGVPPTMEVALDERPLAMFELNDAELTDLRTKHDDRVLEVNRVIGVPTPAAARATLDRLVEEFKPLEAQRERTAEALATLKRSVESGSALTGLPPDERKPLIERRREVIGRLETSLKEASDGLAADRKLTAELQGRLETRITPELWKVIRDLVTRQVRSRIADLFAIQTQARVYLLELQPLELPSETALALAMENRLDLQNARARVTDSWRRVEVAANRLKGDLSVRYEGNLATDPDRDAALRFDASASRHRIGLLLDTPINRRAERNAYRASQIDYQRSRRAWMRTADQIRADIRLDYRDLEQSRRQFEISREQLIAASRQVDEAEFNVRTQTEANNSVTLYLLQALQSLLAARNGLISSWVNYETARMNLYRNLDLMEIDADGAWSNERTAPVGPRSDAAPSTPPDPQPVEILDDDTPASPGR